MGFMGKIQLVGSFKKFLLVLDLDSLYIYIQIYVYVYIYIYISFVYLFTSVLGLRCFEGYSLVALQGLLIVVASLIEEYRL